jgi:signal transduction histidine kinase
VADGAVHVHTLAGPGGSRLLALERTIQRADAPAGPAQAWRLLVAADTAEPEAAARRFDRVRVLSLLVLFVLLGAAALGQVVVGLAPLRALQRELIALREGGAQRLDGRHPAELQPLVDDFNAVLDRNTEVVLRARTQAGNLAHALKTPLAAMAQQAEAAQGDAAAAAELPALVGEQVALARRHVDWHLARSRAAASQGVPGVRTPVEPVLRGLVRVLQRLHADRSIAIAIELDDLPSGAAFAGEREDLQEMLGNLLDNACQWAGSRVRVSALPGATASWLAIVVEDDGPGIDPRQRAQVLARGGRLDVTVPGSGLGLAIVQELAGLYGGRLELDRADAGGLRARLILPADHAPPLQGKRGAPASQPAAGEAAAGRSSATTPWPSARA